MNIPLQFVGGIMYSMVLWVIIAGLVLKFSNLRIPDFAHASFYMLGAYITYSVISSLPDNPLVFFLAMIIAFIAIALVGGLVEVFLLRPIYHKVHHILQAVLTFALILVFADVVRFFWGLTPKHVPKPTFIAGSFTIGGYSFPNSYILIGSVGIAVGIGLWLLLNKTKTGSIIKAITDDPEMASCLNINVPRWTTGIFMLGCGLAGLGGALVTLQMNLGPGMDSTVLLNLFIVLVIAGIGSYVGALVATLILGQVTAFGVIFVPDMVMVIPFVLMALILIARPWGLFGKPETGH